MSPPYLAAIQINAQHLLRYLAFAVLVHKRRRNVMKDLIRIIQVCVFRMRRFISLGGCCQGLMFLFRP